MTVQKTYLQISTFINSGRSYRVKYDAKKRPIAGTTAPIETKMEYAIDKMILRVTNLIKSSVTAFTDRCEDIRTENCMTIDRDGRQVILKETVTAGDRSEERYLYSPEKDKAVRKALRDEIEKMDALVFDVEPYIATVIPTNLTLEQIEAFRGFVIPEDYESVEPAD